MLGATGASGACSGPPVGRLELPRLPSFSPLGIPDSAPVAGAQLHPNLGDLGLEDTILIGILQKKQGHQTCVLNQQAGEVTAAPVPRCARPLRRGEGQGCRPVPKQPDSFRQIQRETSGPSSLSLAEALAHPPHLALVCAPTADSQEQGLTHKGRAYPRGMLLRGSGEEVTSGTLTVPVPDGCSLNLSCY